MSDESEVALILRRFEESTEPFDEHDVDSALLSLKPSDHKDWQPPTDYIAERTAFAFDERVTDEKDGDYTWFAPMMSGRGDDGTPWEWPSVSGITKEMLDYWIERAKASQHPILKARYAGLAWEFSPRVAGGSAPIDMAHIRVDAVLEMAAHDHHEHDVEVCGKLGQALGLARIIHGR